MIDKSLVPLNLLSKNAWIDSDSLDELLAVVGTSKKELVKLYHQWVRNGKKGKPPAIEFKNDKLNDVMAMNNFKYVRFMAADRESGLKLADLPNHEYVLVKGETIIKRDASWEDYEIALQKRHKELSDVE